MKFSNLALAAIALVCLVGAAQPSRAAQIIYDGVGFLSGSQTFTDSFSVAGPGTLTVTLENIDWPQQLASLNLVVGTSSGMLGPEMGAGTQSFDVAGPATIFAQWFGSAQGPLNLGAFALKITFQAANAAVPLPASLTLLASGFLLLLWQRRHRRQWVLAAQPISEA